MNHILVPADVPSSAHAPFVKNYSTLTKNTGNLLLFTADHKIEHLNKDFAMPNLPPEAHTIEHIFEIAAQAPIGALATHPGLIERYGTKYPSIPYIAKLNAKTDIIPTQDQDPVSLQLYSIADIMQLKQTTPLNICGVGYTIYLGSEYEQTMLHEAAQLILQAHMHGLVTILWLYPRGTHISNEFDPELIAGAAGVANSLGADFVKVHPPRPQNLITLEHIITAAGNTKVIFSGGAKKDPALLLEDIALQLQAGSAGAAIGRNIYQNTTEDAVKLTRALAALIYEE